MASAMAVCSIARVRAWTLRRAVLTCDPPGALGDRSGESDGTERRRAPRRAMACWPRTAVWACQWAITTLAPGLRGGTPHWRARARHYLSHLPRWHGACCWPRTRLGSVECWRRWGVGWAIPATPRPPAGDPPAPHPDGQTVWGEPHSASATRRVDRRLLGRTGAAAGALLGG